MATVDNRYLIGHLLCYLIKLPLNVSKSALMLGFQQGPKSCHHLLIVVLEISQLRRQNIQSRDDIAILLTVWWVFLTLATRSLRVGGNSLV